jgi:hypothetical protein
LPQHSKSEPELSKVLSDSLPGTQCQGESQSHLKIVKAEESNFRLFDRDGQSYEVNRWTGWTANPGTGNMVIGWCLPNTREAEICLKNAIKWLPATGIDVIVQMFSS